MAFKPNHNVHKFAKLAYAEVNDPTHDYQHGLQVLDNAVNILIGENIQLTDCEREILSCVMICHDIADYKFPIDQRLSDDEIRRFYVSEYGTAKADLIQHIHANCSWSKRKESQPVSVDLFLQASGQLLADRDRLRKVLQDADWIESMGESGIQRCYSCQRRWHPDETEEQIKQRVCDYIEEKLIHVPHELNYGTTKRMVRDRDFMRPLYEYLREHGRLERSYAAMVAVGLFIATCMWIWWKN